MMCTSLFKKKITVSMQVVHEMNRLRTHSPLHSCVPILSDIPDDLKFVYHNSRSLHLQFSDFTHEKNMHTSDIIATSESRLNDYDRSNDFEIRGFNIYRFDDLNTGNTDRSYRGIVVVYSKLNLSEVRWIFSCIDVEAVLVCFNHLSRILSCILLLLPSKSQSEFSLQNSQSDSGHS